jgi:cation diffusion facilitator family transporter
VTQTEDASLRTVVVAVAANLLVAVAKGVAAVLTGSAAMLAETTHSIADTLNELLLYVGVRRGARPADERHPFGYGQARYTWSLLAAVGIFVVGGLFAIADGVQTLRRPEPVTNVPVGVAVLLMRRNLALLVDQAAPADISERLRQAVAAEPWVAEVAAVYIAVEVTPVERAP